MGGLSWSSPIQTSRGFVYCTALSGTPGTSILPESEPCPAPADAKHSGVKYITISNVMTVATIFARFFASLVFAILNHLTHYTLIRNLRDTARKAFQKQKRSFQPTAQTLKKQRFTPNTQNYYSKHANSIRS